MSNDIELKVKVDTTGLRDADGQIKKTTQNLEELGNATDKAGGKSKTLQQHAATLQGHISELGRRFAQTARDAISASGAFDTLERSAGGLTDKLGGTAGLSASLSGVGAAAGRFAAAMGPVGLAVAGATVAVVGLSAAQFALNRNLGEFEDRENRLEAKIAQTVGSYQRARQELDSLREATQKTGLGFDAAAEAFVRFARNNETLGLSTAEISKLVETLQKAGAISGASTQETKAAVIQLAQGLSDGKLRAEELKSLLGSMPELVTLLAKNFETADGRIGTTREGLFRLGEEGKIASYKAVEAWLRGAADIDAAYAKIPNTMEQATNRLGDNFSALMTNMGRTFQSSEFVQGVYQFLNNVAASLNQMFERLNRQKTEERIKETEQALASGRNPNPSFSDVLSTGALQMLPGGLGYPLAALAGSSSREGKPLTAAERQSLQAQLERDRESLKPSTAQSPEEIAGIKGNAVVRRGQQTALQYPESNATANRIEANIAEMRRSVSQLDSMIRGESDPSKRESLGRDRSALLGSIESAEKALAKANAQGGGANAIATALKAANDQLAEMALRTRQVRSNMDLIGASREKVIAADAENEAALTRLQKFGEKSTSGIEKWFGAYRAALLDSKKAAQEASEANRVYEASVGAVLNRRLLNAAPNPRAQAQARFDYAMEQAEKDFTDPRRYAEFYMESLSSQRDARANEERMSNEGLRRTLRANEDQSKLGRLSSDEYRVQLSLLQRRLALEAEGVDSNEKYYQTQMRLTEMIERQAIQQERRFSRERGIITTLEQGARSLEGTFKDTFQTIFTDGVEKGANIFGRGFGEIIKKISADMIYLIAVKPFEELAAQFASKLGQFILSYVMPGGFSAGSAKPYSSQPGQNITGSSIRKAANGGVFGFANGGAFTNQIITSPTLFAFADGGALGLMGEAGPEAVMPLRRGSDGKLGVAAGGGSGVSVVINDMRSSQTAERPEVKEGRGPDGRRMISVLIRDEVRRQIRSGDLDREMSGSYGATRTLARK